MLIGLSLKIHSSKYTQGMCPETLTAAMFVKPLNWKHLPCPSPGPWLSYDTAILRINMHLLKRTKRGSMCRYGDNLRLIFNEKKMSVSTQIPAPLAIIIFGRSHCGLRGEKLKCCAVPSYTCFPSFFKAVHMCCIERNVNKTLRVIELWAIFIFFMLSLLKIF